MRHVVNNMCGSDPLENILGAKLPSGRDVMRNIVHYHSEKREH